MTNGSEGIPEHPTGTDYKALIEEVRALFDEGWCVCRSSHLPGDLLDAVEALLAENDRLRTYYEERDALQAQLDSMTTEWAWEHAQGRVVCRNESDARERYADGVRSDEHRQNAYRGKNRIVTRLVGPWTPVEGEDR